MYINAIIDYINTENKLLKQDNLFQVFSNDDSLSVCIIGCTDNKIYYLLRIQDWSIMSDKWYADSTIIRDTVHNKTVVIVDDSVSPKKIWYDDSVVRGSYDLFPDGVYEFGEKLFYWNSDVSVSRSQELIETVYNHSVVDTLVDKIMWPEYVIDDGKKSIVYVFSRGNLKKYKKKTGGYLR